MTEPKANPFKNLLDSRRQPTDAPESAPPTPPDDGAEPSPTSNRISPRRKGEKAKRRNSEPSPPPATPPIADPSPAKKRGRPATGKRSNPGWVGRTYYIQQTTDQAIEAELLALKHEGQAIDKSQLVDALLMAWVQFRQGEKAELLLRAIEQPKPE
jgi:cytoskeletal protein RodZ